MLTFENNKANTECTLRGTDIPCNENIEYKRYGKCSEIPVTYKYEVCNEESISITPDKKKSKAKLDKVNKGKVNGPIAAGQCWSKFVDDTINDCDKTPIRIRKLHIFNTIFIHLFLTKHVVSNGLNFYRNEI